MIRGEGERGGDSHLLIRCSTGDSLPGSHRAGVVRTTENTSVPLYSSEGSYGGL